MKRLCIINAAEDSGHAKHLTRHLAMLLKNGLITVVEEMDSCDIAVILMSNDLVVEPRAWALSEAAKRRRAMGACTVIPILCEPMAEVPDFLMMLRTLPLSGKPVSRDNPDADWAGIAAQIRAVAMRSVL